MPIKPEARFFYPIDWKEISSIVRFERAQGRCEVCSRPHGKRIMQLKDGRWFDTASRLWLDDQGICADWPDMVEISQGGYRLISLSAAHLDHNPSNSDFKNIKALCQRCHLRHDRKEHLKRRRVTLRLRRASGDLFTGRYRLY